jgi:hypothetical protein
MSKVVLFEFAGRRANMEIQLPFLRRILAEHPNTELHIWNLARTKEDAEYLHTITGERIQVLDDYSHIREGANFEAVYRHYANQPELRDYLFVKLDDDILFIQTERFGEYLDAIDKNRDCMVFPKVINNFDSIRHEPRLWRKFLTTDFHGGNDTSLMNMHESNEFAVILNQYMFDHWREMLNEPIALVPSEDWSAIHMVGFDWPMMAHYAPRLARDRHGVDIPRFVAGVDCHDCLAGDEGLANCYPRLLMKGFLAGHLSFQCQKATDEQETAWRERYSEIAREYLDRPSKRSRRLIPPVRAPIKPTPDMKVPKRVFLFWAQGWDNTPELPQHVADSWRLHNPGWEVVCLDVNTLHEWIALPVLDCELPSMYDIAPGGTPVPEMTVQAATDIIRLNLLNRYGGVWADASMMCARPLDEWVDEAVAPSGFWMYHGGPDKMFAAMFFLAALPKSLIISRWAHATNDFWANKPDQYAYQWVDHLFMNLLDTDAEFRESWKRVPYITCDRLDGSHALGFLDRTRYEQPPDEAWLQPVRDAVPFMLKLDLRAYCPNTNSWEIAEWALTPRKGTPVVWDEPPCELDTVIRGCSPLVPGWTERGRNPKPPKPPADPVAARWGSNNWRTRAFGGENDPCAGRYVP